MEKQNKKLIIGLGNPGDQYRYTYHNAGMLLLEYLAEKHGISEKFKRPMLKNFEYLECPDFILIRPRTFMNESGKATKEAASYFKAPVENIHIAHDDVDIDLGDFKLTAGQGAAGHHGIESAIDYLKSKDFRRIRIGVKKEVMTEEGIKKIKAGDYVLSRISKNDMESLESVFGKITDKIHLS